MDANTVRRTGTAFCPCVAADAFYKGEATYALAATVVALVGDLVYTNEPAANLGAWALDHLCLEPVPHGTQFYYLQDAAAVDTTVAAHTYA